MNNNLNKTDLEIPKEYYGFIYKTIFPNGMIYVGYTTKRVDVPYYGSGTAVYPFIRKFKKKNLQREILRFVYNDKQINIWERIYVKKFKANQKNIGYNIQNGGVGKGKNVSETKKNIGNSNKRWYKENGTETRKGVNNGMFGKKRLDYKSPFTGQKHSDKSKSKISKKVKGKKNPMYGKTHSPEARERIRQAMINRHASLRLVK